MQVHNHGARKTIFPPNHWREGWCADVGIGNALNGNPDWTFAAKVGNDKVKYLRVRVRCK